ncbi:hypothetical protein BDY21DRAFT_352338 [Lineolata rhizophorae]|uniref:L-rhamnose-1-dehydrogenase n=1 Tax=Lineolata rhizophorae TaxID=578093 RepID=A0A6A6NT85_9PEZI|nr:hypothetical protein BDY21DRAFT_352338 [Lineolata rhizophorae]
MAGLLKHKSAAITGGVTGIGRAIALEYINQGASVAVNHLGDKQSVSNFEAMQSEASSGSRMIAVPGDITKLKTAERLVAETVRNFGKLDVFVSNAGICEFADFLSVDASLFELTVSTNLGGAFHATREAAREMVRQGFGGSIIGMSSISALVGGSQQVHYTPTKAGVLSLTQSAACALGKHNIRCNALLPGTIKTQLNARDLGSEGKRKYLESRIPLGRLGTPQDLTGPAVFLASDLSAYVTGAQLLVDGGLFVNLQ